MPVRKDEKIHPGDLFAQALQAEFRRSVDLDVEAIHHDMDGRPRPSIPGIVGTADRAIARDHGNALGRAGAEKDDFHGVSKSKP
ncbi:hypothetical protein MASR2M8_26470 [Opitutaceae bacterium]